MLPGLPYCEYYGLDAYRVQCRHSTEQSREQVFRRPGLARREEGKEERGRERERANIFDSNIRYIYCDGIHENCTL